MGDFLDKLNAITNEINENVKAERDDARTKREQASKSEQERKDRASKGEGVAIRIADNCIRPLMEKVRTEIPCLFSDGPRSRGTAGTTLRYRDNEFLAIVIHYDEQGLRLNAQAGCSSGIVYDATSDLLDPSSLNERETEEWIETHLLEAVEAFGRKAHAVRAKNPIVVYKGV
jgi:hypothetical protein